MKKNMLWVVLTLICCLCGTAFAAENEWSELDLAAIENDAITCNILEPVGENEAVKEVLGEITDADWSIGPEDAPITVLEYADFQCPYCSYAGITLIETQAAHPESIRYVYRHFPLNFHEKAPMGAYAADAAGRQGFFFEAEHYLYSTQNEWTDLESLDAFDAWLKENFPANIEGLDEEVWLKDYADEELRANIDGKFDEIIATGLVGGTPTIFVNFNQLEGGYDEATLLNYAKFFEMQKNITAECPKLAVDGDHEYRAILDTTAGELVMDLFAEDTPNAVSAFIALANEGWYDGLNFHRIVPDFVAQTGDPSATGFGTAGFSFANEVNTSVSYGDAGLVGFANSGKDTNSAQFFITKDLNEYFNAAYAAQFPEATEEEIAAHTAEQITVFNEGYPLFGRLTAESMDAFEAIDAETVINSVKIEVRGK